MSRLLTRKLALNTVLHSVVLVVVTNLLLIIAAKLKVPFYPVPITLQTFIVIAVAMSFGVRTSLLALFLYLAEGLIGLPVFAGTPQLGVGLSYILGPTGGYLAGFIAATVVVGYLAQMVNLESFMLRFSLFITGHAVIYVFGLAWLGNFIGFNLGLLQLGLVPFLLGDLLKSAVGAGALYFLKKKNNND